MDEHTDILQSPYVGAALVVAVGAAALVLMLSLAAQLPEKTGAQAAVSEAAPLVSAATTQAPVVRVIIASPYNR